MRNVQLIEKDRAIRTLKTKVARLESINDQLMTELQYIDQLLRLAGFDDGLAMVKAAAAECAELESFGG